MTSTLLVSRNSSVFFWGMLFCISPFLLLKSGVVQKPEQLVTPAGSILISQPWRNHQGTLPDQRIEQLKQSAWYLKTIRNLAAMNPPDTAASWIAEYNVAYAGLGSPVASAGDVNGDGYMDVMIGALGYRPLDYSITGSVFVYYGSSKGLSDTVSTIITLPGGQLITRSFGGTMACVGDVNGDGYDDVMIGDRNADRYAAAAYLFYGSASGLSKSSGWYRSFTHPSFAGSLTVAGAGDVNGDGYDDAIINAYQIEYPSPFDPVPVPRTFYTTYLYYGSASGLTASNWTKEGPTIIGGVGDVNKDGYDDVLIGSPDYSSYGAASLYLGSAAGLGTTAAATVQGDQAKAGFPGIMTSAGDVNRDGYGDVIISAPQWNDSTGTVVKGAGRVYLYLGSSSGLSTTPVWKAQGKQADENFGISIAGAGDVNRDGYADIIVGVGKYSNGDSLEGAAFIYRGAAADLAKDPAWMAEGNQANAYFGISVAGAGDVNHDGMDDVIVGAPRYSHGQQTEGLAFAYFGRAEAALPLHLIQFNAQLAGNKATLRWTTSNETDTRYFEVQRSADGKNFEFVSRTICRGAPGGSLYATTDEMAFTGIRYYRLKMVDADQQYAYSTIVMLRNATGDFWEIHPTLLTRGQLYHLGVNSTEEGKPVTLQIIDINGRIQLQQKLVLIKGYQTFSQRVDLAKGYYVIRLAGMEKEVAAKRIFVQ